MYEKGRKKTAESLVRPKAVPGAGAHNGFEKQKVPAISVTNTLAVSGD